MLLLISYISKIQKKVHHSKRNCLIGVHQYYSLKKKRVINLNLLVIVRRKYLLILKLSCNKQSNRNNKINIQSTLTKEVQITLIIRRLNKRKAISQ